MSVWVDLHQYMFGFESDLTHMVLRKSGGDVRLALLMGMTKVIDKQNRGKFMRFNFCGNEKKGTFECLRLHLSELNRGMGNIRVSCSLFLHTDRFERYMTCEITTMSDQRSDDIFIFLTEIFPALLCERQQ